jgi:hypothetical protein
MLLPQVIVVAFGALFTLLTSVLVFLDYRFGGASHSSEQFSTAGDCNMPQCHAVISTSPWNSWN